MHSPTYYSSPITARTVSISFSTFIPIVCLILSSILRVFSYYVHLKDDARYDESTIALKELINDVRIRLKDVENLRLYDNNNIGY